MKPTLVILAAGLGSRYGSLKQLDTFGRNNETLLEYAVYDSLNAGFGHIVFVIRQFFEEQFSQQVLSKLPSEISYSVAYQEYDTFLPDSKSWKHREKPWGTGHAVLSAKDYIEGPFSVINADDYYGVDGYRQIVNILKKKCKENEFCMIGYVLKNTLSENGTVNRGVCQLDDGKLKSIQEYHKISRGGNGVLQDENGVILSPDSVVSMNFRGFPKSFLDRLEIYWSDFLSEYADSPTKEFYLPSACNRLIDEQGVQCHVSVSKGKWCGVTYKEDKEILQKYISSLIAAKKYPLNLWS